RARGRGGVLRDGRRTGGQARGAAARRGPGGRAPGRDRGTRRPGGPERAGGAGTPYAVAWAAGAGGMVAALQGKWATALERCTAGLAGFRDRCVGVAWEGTILDWLAHYSLAYLGKLDELMRRVPAMLVDAEIRGDLHAVIGNSTGVNNLIW